MIDVLSSAVFALVAAAAPAPAPIIDNDFVTIWDVTLKAGESLPQTSDNEKRVALIIEGGTFKVTRSAQRLKTLASGFGDAIVFPAGQAARLDVLKPDKPDGAHVVLVATKAAQPHHEPTTAIPDAFPRPEARKVYEDSRITVWNFAWTQGQSVAMHHHDKATVMAFRYTGRIKSTDPRGEVSMLPFKQGQITFSLPGRLHTEQLVDPAQAAMFIEFK